MTERRSIDMEAAEYVLGTLDAAERSAVEARRMREQDLDAAIVLWELRLTPLLDEVDPVVPPPAVLASINAAIDRPANEAVADLTALRRRLRRWRTAALASAALAASLAGVLVVREMAAPPPSTFVAIFNDGDTQPRFLMSVDLSSRELTIRPISAEPVAEKAYQLWIVGEGISPVPRSLGLLQDVSGTSHRRLEQFDAARLRTATFGISLEPPGGSPTGLPTGPALHGTLVPATK